MGGSYKSLGRSAAPAVFTAVAVNIHIHTKCIPTHPLSIPIDTGNAIHTHDTDGVVADALLESPPGQRLPQLQPAAAASTNNACKAGEPSTFELPRRPRVCTSVGLANAGPSQLR